MNHHNKKLTGINKKFFDNGYAKARKEIIINMLKLEQFSLDEISICTLTPLEQVQKIAKSLGLFKKTFEFDYEDLGDVLRELVDKGRAEFRKECVINMLKDGILSLEDIAFCTKVPLQQVQEIASLTK